MSAVRSKEELLTAMADAVREMEEEDAAEVSKEYIEAGYDAYDGIEGGLAEGIGQAGDLFEEEEYFIPELLMCSEAMNAGIDVLSPHLKTAEAGNEKTIVIGVAEGDTHDIGKNLVALLCKAAGFKVVDIGRDVPPEKFVDKAIEEKASIIAVSTLMTTTMPKVEAVVEELKKRNVREQFKVMVGGAPISQAFCDKIGADGYTANASEAVRLAKRLAGITV